MPAPARINASCARSLSVRVVNLLDDPFASLDKSSINFVSEVLADFAAQSKQVWVASFYETPAEIAANEVIDLGD